MAAAGAAATAVARSSQLLLPLASLSSSSSFYLHRSLHASLPPTRHKTNGPLSNPRSRIRRSKLNEVLWEEEEGGGRRREEMEGVFGLDGGIEEDDSEEEDEESGFDLLFQFLQSSFRKVSKRATKAARSVLPPVISPRLVSFAVDGVLLLASVSVVKALLEVFCTIGGTAFVMILLLRVIWTILLHFQSSRYDVNEGGSGAYNTSQPAT